MVLTEEMETEITVHMRPHLLATSGSTPAAWWEFTVSSCAGPIGQLRNNCRGLVSIVYEENRSSYMVEEDARIETNHIADYHRTLLELPKTCTKDYFYDRMAKSALPYGEVFQGVENCHPGPGKTCYEVKLVDIGDTFTKGKLDRPFLINPATLDAVLQGWLGSTCYGTTNNENNGNFGFDKPMVPTAIRELEISVDIPAHVEYIMPSVCNSHKHGFNEFSANINVFDKNLSRVFLSITDFRTSPLEIDDAEQLYGEEGNLDADFAGITSEVHWNYALDVIDSSEISQVIVGADTNTTEDKLIQVSYISIVFG
jgi:hypothetical protein